MADLTDYEVYKNNRFEVLTDKGFKDFRGMMSGNNPDKILLKFDNSKSLICTPLHKIMTSSDSHIYAKNLKIGDKIFNDVEIIDINLFHDDTSVYEFLDIKDTHTYFVNGILSHQCLVIDECAFVECVHGNTNISLRNKKTGEIFELSVLDAIEKLSRCDK